MDQERSMNKLDLVIPGVPIAKKRPRFFVRGKHVGAYNAQQTEEGRFMWCLANHLGESWKPLDGPCALQVAFFLPFPASLPKCKRRAIEAADCVHTKKPDADNLMKFVMDCSNGVLFTDDRLVWHMTVCKVYSDEPRTEITLRWE